MTLWNAVLSWFYREFPCGCRIARRWNEARVCPQHLAKVNSGERVILGHKKSNAIGTNVKFRNIR
jgi:hypothetical protein